jgi:hypothetical protein
MLIINYLLGLVLGALRRLPAIGNSLAYLQVSIRLEQYEYRHDAMVKIDY